MPKYKASFISINKKKATQSIVRSSRLSQLQLIIMFSLYFAITKLQLPIIFTNLSIYLATERFEVPHQLRQDS